MKLQEKIEIAKKLQDAICANHSGKMRGIMSLSTSVLLNENCKKNASVNGSICAHCYACKLLKMRHALDEKLERNTELLTKDVLPVDVLPQINTLYFRFEAFGDLNNAIQVVNYFNICRKNKAVRFALWTKNPHIVEDAMKQYNIKKPSNLNIIYSSLFLNTPNKNIKKRFPFIDKIFTVYDKPTIKAENIQINCGGANCASCLICYKKNKIDIINEILK